MHGLLVLNHTGSIVYITVAVFSNVFLSKKKKEKKKSLFQSV